MFQMQNFCALETYLSKHVGANVEGDFERAPTFHTFALSKDKNKV